MPKIFTYVLGRPATLQTIEEIEEKTPEVIEEVVVENSTLLSDTPES